MEREREDAPYIKRWIEEKLDINLRDSTREEQKNGIDFVCDEKQTSYEFKLREATERKYLNADLLIETISNDVINSDGWIKYCKADFLIYLFKPLNDLKGHIINQPHLKKWWSLNEYSRPWKIKYAKNEDYRTKNRVVPLKFLPHNLFIHSDSYVINNQTTMSKWAK